MDDFLDVSPIFWLQKSTYDTAPYPDIEIDAENDKKRLISSCDWISRVVWVIQL